jgi:AcrR family transcriptional regulator
VAARAGISKRTFYHRFDDKAALFAAVVHRIVEQIRPPPEIPLLKGSNLEEVLRRLAGIILQAALSPQAIALNRLIVAESMRFPHLADAVYNGPATREAIDLIAGLLDRDLPDSDLTADLRRFAAAQFLQMVIVMPQRRHTAQNSPMTPKELDQWAQKTVRLFLSGCRGLSGKPETRRAPQRP